MSLIMEWSSFAAGIGFTLVVELAVLGVAAILS
jgi:hypothetical protein